MNILIVGKFYVEGFALHIAETLLGMGHCVRRFDVGLRSRPEAGRLGHRLDQARQVIHSVTDGLPLMRAHRMKALWHTVEQGPLDVVIVCHVFLWPDEVAELKRRTSAQVALWFPDALGQVSRGFFMNAPYDGLFFKDPFFMAALGDVLRSPVHYLPECFNPERHWLPEDAIRNDVAYQCEITTVGNQHSWRVAFYKHLSDYDVKIWGNPAPLWMAAGPVASMHQGRGVYNHDKVRAFRGAKIVVNNLSFLEIWGVNVRCFEVAAAGAFQMVNWRPALSQLFEDNKELITFRTMKDLKQKIDYWLPRDAERRAIAEAGMRRAHAEHTYAGRLSLLLNTLAGTERGYPIPDLTNER